MHYGKTEMINSQLVSWDIGNVVIDFFHPTSVVTKDSTRLWRQLNQLNKKIFDSKKEIFLENI